MNIEQQQLELAIALFKDMPFWKRWLVVKWYKSNNWDVKGYWKICFTVARKMIEDTQTVKDFYA